MNFGGNVIDVFVDAFGSDNPSNAVVNQESRGQSEFVNSSTLPKKCNFCERWQLESMGVEFLDDYDDLFVNVNLPNGWQKVTTEHNMWSKLVDENGNERASIFYKAAFYDRNAHISLTHRFYYNTSPVDGWEKAKTSKWICKVFDVENEIWCSEMLEKEPSTNSRDEWLAWYAKRDALLNLGKKWLDENYPDWENPLAYW